MVQMQEDECANGDGEDLGALLADLAQVNNSRERANKLFQWLISPVPAKSFFRYGLVRWQRFCLSLSANVHSVRGCVHNTRCHLFL